MINPVPYVTNLASCVTIPVPYVANFAPYVANFASDVTNPFPYVIDSVAGEGGSDGRCDDLCPTVTSSVVARFSTIHGSR